MRNIGIVCEGPTDYTILKEVIDHITGESNDYVQLQPEADLTGAYGNGWKGVWKWCRDNAACKEKLMRAVEPSLDLLIIQMDGDVSRKLHIAYVMPQNVNIKANIILWSVTAKKKYGNHVQLFCHVQSIKRR